MIKVLFVCLGNICRSPMAQFVLQQMVDKEGLTELFEIDSAGTHDHNEKDHAGIYYRTKDILTDMKVPFSEHYSKQIRKSDYQNFDYILTMDEGNIEDLKTLLGEDKSKKIYKLLDFTSNPRNIKDPWYTGNFDETYWDVVEGCQSFLKWLKDNKKI